MQLGLPQKFWWQNSCLCVDSAYINIRSKLYTKCECEQIFSGPALTASKINSFQSSLSPRLLVSPILRVFLLLLFFGKFNLQNTFWYETKNQKIKENKTYGQNLLNLFVFGVWVYINLHRFLSVGFYIFFSLNDFLITEIRNPMRDASVLRSERSASEGWL